MNDDIRLGLADRAPNPITFEQPRVLEAGTSSPTERACRLSASCFVRRTPKVQGFLGGYIRPTLNQLPGIKVFAATKMCRVMTKHGSDKGFVSKHDHPTIILFGCKKTIQRHNSLALYHIVTVED
jgi:hypothetical protein